MGYSHTEGISNGRHDPLSADSIIRLGQLGEPGNVVVEADRDLERLTRWAKSSQDGGSPIWMQINHPGRQANALVARNRPVAPSALAIKVPGASRPRAMTVAEIEDTITLDRALDLQRHADQLQRLGSGSAPDVTRPWWKSAASMIKHNGVDAFRSKRG